MDNPAIPGEISSRLKMQNKAAKKVIKFPQNSKRIASHLEDKISIS